MASICRGVVETGSAVPNVRLPPQKKIAMRPAQKSNRARGRGNRKNGGGGGGNNINRVYESAGPEGKVRGTPQQIVDKYLSLARDAQTSGDRVTAENFLQHAEHYQRLLLTAMGAQESRRETQPDDDDDEAPQAESARSNGHSAEGDAQPEEAAADAHGESNGHAGQAPHQNGQGRRSRRNRGPRPNGEQSSEGAGGDEGGDAAAHAGNGATATDGATITGFDTIDTDGSRGPDLLVDTEEIAKSQPRRRRPRPEPGADADEAVEAVEPTPTAEGGEA